MQLPGDGFRERIFDERAFPGPGNARDAGEGSQGNPQIHIPQVMLPGADQFQPQLVCGGLLGEIMELTLTVVFAPPLPFSPSPPLLESIRREAGIGIAKRSPRYCPVREVFLLASCLGVPSPTMRAAEPAGSGAEVVQAVGGLEHFAVMLDQDQRVAQVAEFFEGF